MSAKESSLVKFRDFLHDAELNASQAIDGYRLPQTTWDGCVLAVTRIAEAAQELADIFECDCDDAYTGRGLHGPYCRYEDGRELHDALSVFAWSEDE